MTWTVDLTRLNASLFSFRHEERNLFKEPLELDVEFIGDVLLWAHLQATTKISCLICALFNSHCLNNFIISHFHTVHA